jgi:hypothetical protein
MEAPAGSKILQLRQSQQLAAMQLSNLAGDETPPMVPFTLVLSQIRLVEAQKPLPFACFIAEAPQDGEVIQIDAERMTVAFLAPGDAPVEMSGPRALRFIAIPSLEAAPARFQLLGLVHVNNQWCRLYCPDLHPLGSWPGSDAEETPPEAAPPTPST